MDELIDYIDALRSRTSLLTDIVSFIIATPLASSLPLSSDGDLLRAGV